MKAVVGILFAGAAKPIFPIRLFTRTSNRNTTVKRLKERQSISYPREKGGEDPEKLDFNQNFLNNDEEYQKSLKPKFEEELDKRNPEVKESLDTILYEKHEKKGHSLDDIFKKMRCDGSAFDYKEIIGQLIESTSQEMNVNLQVLLKNMERLEEYENFKEYCEKYPVNSLTENLTTVDLALAGWLKDKAEKISSVFYSTIVVFAGLLRSFANLHGWDVLERHTSLSLRATDRHFCEVAEPELVPDMYDDLINKFLPKYVLNFNKTVFLLIAVDFYYFLKNFNLTKAQLNPDLVDVLEVDEVEEEEEESERKEVKAEDSDLDDFDYDSDGF